MNNQNVTPVTPESINALYNDKTKEVAKKIGKELREAGVVLHQDACCTISTRLMSIRIIQDGKAMIGSDVTVYTKSKSWDGEVESESIDFPTSGSFSPKDIAPLWRTIHAGSILQNWEAVCRILSENCNGIEEYRKELFELRKKAVNY